ncbi:hypothetical protein MrNuV_ORF017 [Macrobrachium rosenbergii nudivirus]|nr:hypothetical protein MrNuV_ORF017 [Macrobrachium rosenbergii nudivirus]
MLSQNTTNNCFTFQSLECICDSMNEEISFSLKPKQLKCILHNYKLYLKSRALWNLYTPEYKEVIEYNIRYPCKEINNVTLSINLDFDITNPIHNGTFKMFLPSKISYANELEKAMDLICCLEFEKFVNTHVYNNDMQNLLQEASKIYDEIKKSNF